MAATSANLTGRVAYSPSPRHILRLLGASSSPDVDGLSSTITAPLTADLFAPDTNIPRLGIVAAIVDMVGGYTGLRAAAPSWTATQDLNIQMTGGHGTANMPRVGQVLRARSQVIRAGKSQVVVGVDVDACDPSNAPDATLTDAARSSIAYATMTMSRLDARPGTPTLAGLGSRRAEMQPVVDRGDFLTELGVELIDPSTGRFRLAMSPDVTNSFGALHGGAIGVLADLAAAAAARHRHRDQAVFTSDLEIRYLALGKVGPFETSATVWGSIDDGWIARSEIRDRGQSDRLLTVALARVAPTDAEATAGFIGDGVAR